MHKTLIQVENENESMNLLMLSKLENSPTNRLFVSLLLHRLIKLKNLYKKNHWATLSFACGIGFRRVSFSSILWYRTYFHRANRICAWEWKFDRFSRNEANFSFVRKQFSFGNSNEYSWKKTMTNYPAIDQIKKLDTDLEAIQIEMCAFLLYSITFEQLIFELVCCNLTCFQFRNPLKTYAMPWKMRFAIKKCGITVVGERPIKNSMQHFYI